MKKFEPVKEIVCYITGDITLHKLPPTGEMIEPEVSVGGTPMPVRLLTQSDNSRVWHYEVPVGTGLHDIIVKYGTILQQKRIETLAGQNCYLNFEFGDKR